MIRISTSKENEGANYFDMNFPGGSLAPGDMFTYNYQTPDFQALSNIENLDSFTSRDFQTSTALYVYQSHANVNDIYAGLIGMLVIGEEEVDKEFFTLFMVKSPPVCYS